MLRLVLPKGSLERATLELFEAADLPVVRSSAVDYKATIDDPRIAEVRILRPQEIATYVAEGLFDIGITGRDWVEETSSDVVSLGEMRYSKATSLPIRVVVAVAGDSPAERIEDLPHGLRVSTEYPELTRRFFESKGIEADIRLSYGASEAKIPDIADCIVDITETGRALRAAGLRIIDTILVSYTEVIANSAAHADPVKRHAMNQLMTLLNGTLDARGKVLVKLNVGADQLSEVLALVPSLKAPTVSELAGGGGFAVETVVAKNQINTL
ncbi:MAG: phosphoribosyltransferase, partial [Actinomycetota bacterium]